MTLPNDSVLFLLPGYLVLVAFAIFVESAGLHRFGWPDGRLSRVFRLQEPYIIAVSLLNVLFGGRDGAKVAGYRGRESQGTPCRLTSRYDKSKYRGLGRLENHRNNKILRANETRLPWRDCNARLAAVLQSLPVSVRIGQSVDVVGKAGNPKSIVGGRVQTTPVLMCAGEKAELTSDQYESLSSVLEGVVILREKVIPS